MNIIAIDDEESALSILVEEISNAFSNIKVNGFLLPEKALEFVKDNPCDIAFLDIEMPQINGITLAKKLKQFNPKMNFIFVTAYQEYGVDAMQIHASGYILKPVTKKAVIQEINNLRFPIENNINGVTVTTFGNFDIKVDGKSVHFGRTKSKELLAYLIDRRGSGITKKEIASILFEDKSYDHTVQDYVNKIIRDMESSLKKVGQSKIIVKRHNYYAINPDSIYCDLYEYEKGNPLALSKFYGEYMSQYSWGEITLSNLEKI